MNVYKFITDDNISKFCHFVTEALSHGWTLYMVSKSDISCKRKRELLFVVDML